MAKNTNSGKSISKETLRGVPEVLRSGGIKNLDEEDERVDDFTTISDLNDKEVLQALLTKFDLNTNREASRMLLDKEYINKFVTTINILDNTSEQKIFFDEFANDFKSLCSNDNAGMKITVLEQIS